MRLAPGGAAARLPRIIPVPSDMPLCAPAFQMEQTEARHNVVSSVGGHSLVEAPQSEVSMTTQRWGVQMRTTPRNRWGSIRRRAPRIVVIAAAFLSGWICTPALSQDYCDCGYQGPNDCVLQSRAGRYQTVGPWSFYDTDTVNPTIAAMDYLGPTNPDGTLSNPPAGNAKLYVMIDGTDADNYPLPDGDKTFEVSFNGSPVGHLEPGLEDYYLNCFDISFSQIQFPNHSGGLGVNVVTITQVSGFDEEPSNVTWLALDLCDGVASGAKVTFTVEPPNVYPLPPDGKSFGYLKSYDSDGQLIEGITWYFADGNRLNCPPIGADGKFVAGTQVGETKVTGLRDGCPLGVEKTIRIDCSSNDCQSCLEPGRETVELDPDSGGMGITLDLGRAGQSGSAGTLTIQASVPSDNLSTPAGLNADILNEGVEVIQDPNTKTLRQVYNPAQALVDILPNGPSEYSVSYYRPSQAGAKRPSTWSPLGSSSDGLALSLTVYNGKLIVGRAAQPSEAIAAWDGSSWSTIDGGVDDDTYPDYAEVDALTVYNGELIAGGIFTTAGGRSANCIARWNATDGWRSLDGPQGNGVAGAGGWIAALTIYNGELIVAGDFTTAGGRPANLIARWNATDGWRSLDGPQGNGIGGAGRPYVAALTVYNGELIAGGWFDTAGSQLTNYIARWNPTDGWRSLDGPQGNAVDSGVEALGIYNGELIAGGCFWTAGGEDAYCIARWNATDGWRSLSGPADNGMDFDVYALTIFDGNLIAGGHFTTAGGLTANYIAKWNGTSWSPVGDHPSNNGMDGDVYALTIFSGSLIAAGFFGTAGGVGANRIASGYPGSWNSYEVSGSPFIKYIVSNRAPSSGNDQLRLVKYMDGVAKSQYDYKYTEAASTWELDTADAGGNIARIESLANQDLGGGSRATTTTVFTVTDGAMTPAYEEYREYTPIASGKTSFEVMTSKHVDPGESDLTTTWYYYTSPDDDANHARSGRMQSVVNPDGSWIVYDYDAQGRTIMENRSWLDDAKPALANDAGTGRRTVYDYTPVDGNDTGEADYTTRARTVTEYVHGTMVARTFHAYHHAADGKAVEILQQDTGSGNAYNSPNNLTTTTTYYASTDPAPQAGRVYTVVYPDGQMDTYTYAGGGYDSAGHAFDPAGSGVMQTIVTHGAISSPGGIASRTTQDVTVVDDLRPVWLEETRVCTGPGTFESLGATWYEYDDAGHRTAAHYPNRTQTLSGWGCCNMDWQVAVDGTMTNFDQYDVLGKLLQKTVAGIAGSGSAGDVGYRPNIATVYTYDGMGRQLTSTVGGTLTTETGYRLDGRIDHTTDASGLQTVYTYPGPHTRAVTRSGEATETTEYYLDAQIKSVTRGGVITQYCTYGLEGSNLVTRTYNGDNGSASWSETVVDGLGRPAAERRSGYGGTAVQTTYEYYTDAGPGKGKLKRATPSAGAATIYEYDDCGEVCRTGLDADGDGALTIASTDRITDTTIQYLQEAGAWWRATTTSVYDRDGDGHNVVASTQKECVGGLSSGVLSKTRSIDAYGNETMATVTVDAASKMVTQAVIYPDSGVTEETITLNGLVDSVTSKTGLLTRYAYDALGRQIKQIDPRKGTTVTGYYNAGVGAKGKVQYVVAPDGSFTVYAFDTNGRLFLVRDPVGKMQYFQYNDRGQRTYTWGDTTYPIAYEYDDFGRMLKMKTYRDPGGTHRWNGPTLPGPADAGAEITQWVYDPSSGLLTNKIYPDGRHVDYTYFPDGRLWTRTWARGVVTTYAYYGAEDNLKTGEPKTVTYSDGTPGLTYSYSRLGQPATVTQTKADPDGWTRTTAFTPNDFLQIGTEAITGDLYNKTITRGYQGAGAGEVPGRAGGFSIGTDYSVAYGYDTLGRLNAVTGPGLPAGGVAYTRLANSELIEYARYNADASTTLASWHRTYEPARDLLSSVENSAGGMTISKYAYSNDLLGRRTGVVHTGTAFPATYNTQWGYNNRSELTSADRYTGTTLGTHTASPFAFGYNYDNIGNRMTYQQDGTAPGTYTTNDLNQYQKILPSGQSLSYDGDGNLSRVGSLADLNGDGQVDLADYSLFASHVGGPTQPGQGGNWQQADFNGDGHVDLKDFLLFQKAFGGPTVMIYSWDGENRLTSVEPQVPTEGLQKVVFAYDYLGRRVQKKMYTYSSGAWVLGSDQRFVYDGWNVVLVLDADGTTARKHTWGLDLSGGLQGAGGIGGLLAVEETAGTNAGSYWFLYDGNGNVGQVIRASDQSTAARYEYDPYGNSIVSDGAYANANPFRFSSKQFDAETTFYYYVYRYYSPYLGRWISRDPVAESGGANLYTFAGGNPIVLVDPMGLWYLHEPIATYHETVNGVPGVTTLHMDTWGSWYQLHLTAYMDGRSKFSSTFAPDPARPDAGDAAHDPCKRSDSDGADSQATPQDSHLINTFPTQYNQDLFYLPSAGGIELEGSAVTPAPYLGGILGLGFHYDFDNPGNTGLYLITGTGAGLNVGVSLSPYVAYGTQGQSWSGWFANGSVGAPVGAASVFWNDGTTWGVSAGPSLGLPWGASLNATYYYPLIGAN